MNAPFERGSVVAHRDLQAGKVWFAHATIVVEDTPERLLLYWMPGADARAPVGSGGAPLRIWSEPWTLMNRPWTDTCVLCHWRPGDPFSVWLFWEEGSFLGWYVNLQAPFRRVATGFDAVDDVLDVWIEPGGSWSWKDEDELEECVRLGLLSGDQAAAISEHARPALERCSLGEEPFDAVWPMWTPDPAWPTPELPEGWDVV